VHSHRARTKYVSDVDGSSYITSSYPSSLAVQPADNEPSLEQAASLHFAIRNQRAAPVFPHLVSLPQSPEAFRQSGECSQPCETIQHYTGYLQDQRLTQSTNALTLPVEGPPESSIDLKNTQANNSYFDPWPQGDLDSWASLGMDSDLTAWPQGDCDSSASPGRSRDSTS
jgi:hypothetical protein